MPSGISYCHGSHTWGQGQDKVGWQRTRLDWAGTEQIVADLSRAEGYVGKVQRAVARESGCVM